MIKSSKISIVVLFCIPLVIIGCRNKNRSSTATPQSQPAPAAGNSNPAHSSAASSQQIQQSATFHPNPIGLEPRPQSDESKFSSAMNKLAKEGHERLQASRSNRNRDQIPTPGLSVDCDDSHPCPWSEGVGLITLSGGSCVATLIDRDIIVTAGHCLSDYEIGDSIHGLFSLPSLSKAGRKIGFENIPLKMLITKSGQPYEHVDFAFVSLQDPAIKHSPIKVSREGFFDGETYSTIGKDLVAGSSTFQKWSLRNSCYSSYQNIISPFYNDKHDPFVSLSDCPIGAGNSGAPILNKKNELVGVARGHIDMNVYKFTHQYLLDHGFTKHTRTVFLAGVTNFSCMPDVIAGSSVVSAACDQDGANKLVTNNKKDSALDKLILPKLNGLTDSGKFRRSTETFVALRTTYVWTPECIDINSLKTDSGRLYLDAALYSPLIDDKFNISNELSEPFNTKMFVENVTSGGETALNVTVEFSEGINIFRGQIKKCGN